MTRDELLGEILSLPVWDTHSHLEGARTLAAQSFWDFGHYFWFLRELQGVGYPALDDAMALPEAERADAYARALHLARNTAWTQAVRRTLKDLWHVEITDADSLLAASAAIAETGQDPAWPRTVCGKLNIATLTVGRVTDNGIGEIEDLLHLMGSCRLPSDAEAEELLAADSPRDAVARRAAQIEAQVAEFAAAGRRVVRTALPTGTAVPELHDRGNTAADVHEVLRHALLRALDAHGCHVQVFLGMTRPTPGYEPRTRAHRHFALNDPGRVAALHDLFDLYAGCTFELVNAAQLSNLDIVQAARIYRNVVPGGLWWFNFRPSTYRENMQYRLEGLPASRCTLLASDARCIEWCYCKTLLVKRLLADFLHDQVVRGWLDHPTALHVAREWLHDAPARLYRGPAQG